MMGMCALLHMKFREFLRTLISIYFSDLYKRRGWSNVSFYMH